MAKRGFSGISPASGNVAGSSGEAGSSGNAPINHGTGIGGDTSSLDGIPSVDPAGIAGTGDAAGSAGGNGGSNTGRRKPGRPAGSGSGRTGANSGETKSAAAVKSDGQAATAILSSIHQMLALYLQAPAIALTPQEAEDLGNAIAAVQKFYPASVFDPKYTAWAALAMVAFRIEAPRAIIAVNAVKAKKANAPT